MAADLTNSEKALYEIDYRINEVLNVFQVPGAAVGLIVDDQIILSKGYGTCKVNETLPVSDRTLFPIGSCTKAFTALLVSQLVDEGKLAFDDPVIKYIPELCLFNQELTDNLTIRDVLAHRTGIPRHEPLWLFFNFPRSAVVSLLRPLEPICGLREVFQYNNLMYVLAAAVIERITGQSWEDAMVSRLFKPLGMTDSNVSLKEHKSSLDFSYPHAEIENKITTLSFYDLASINSAGGVNSNVSEMIKWMRWQLSGSQKMLHSTTLQEMQTVQMPFPLSSAGPEETYMQGYGFGWFIGKYRGHDLVSHGGDIHGFSADVSFLTNEKIGLVILTNSSSDGHYVIASIRNHIFDVYLNQENIDWIQKIKPMRDETKLILKKSQESFQELFQIPQPDSLANYIGVYEHSAYGLLEVQLENNHLVVNYGTLTLPLYFKSENVFTGQSDLLQVYGVDPIIDVTFFRNPSGVIYKLEIPFEGFRSAYPIIFTAKNT